MAHAGGLGQAAALRLGIDFGTTRTVVAAVDDGRHPIAAFDHDGEFRDYIPLSPALLAALPTLAKRVSFATTPSA